MQPGVIDAGFSFWSGKKSPLSQRTDAAGYFRYHSGCEAAGIGRSGTWTKVTFIGIDKQRRIMLDDRVVGPDSRSTADPLYLALKYDLSGQTSAID